ncbi:MAG: hypothetical protein PHI35_07745, partial [Victivallaceae bacterium]|nr:hypothetical protein [Victivallaceae bacterium]
MILSIKRVSPAKLILVLGLSLVSTILSAEIKIDKAGYLLRISDDGARIIELTAKKTDKTFVRDAAVWNMKLNSDATLDSKRFLASGGSFSHEKNENSLTLKYSSKERSFDVVFDVSDNQQLEYRVKNLKNNSGAICFLSVPANFAFPLADMKRFLYPTQANWSMGICFLPSFFEKRSEENVIYKTAAAPFNGMEKLFGSKTVPISNKEFKQKSHVTTTQYGKSFYNEAEKNELQQAQGRITIRQSRQGGLDLVFLCMLNDPNPLLLGTRFGGKGFLFQMQGANQNGSQREVYMGSIFHSTVSALLRNHPELLKGKKIILLDYPNTPKLVTGFDPVSLDLFDWHNNLKKLEKKFGIHYAVAGNIGELRAALNSDAAGMIVNPYGNIFPSAEPEKFAADLAAIKSYVKRGGIWWESGSRSFDTLLRKTYFSEYDRQARYPSAAADYACAEYGTGSIALFGVQPTMRFPYDRERAAIPAAYDLRGSAKGAAFDHQWVLWVDARSKKLWNSSPYRISFRYATPREGLAEYEKTLELNSKLADKVKPAEKLEKMKNSMLICAWHESATENERSFAVMPPDNIAHFIGALASRFDANYPEHLPPDPKWGTMDDLRKMVEFGHKCGHFVMPYTNTTWWLPHENGKPSPSMAKWM